MAETKDIYFQGLENLTTIDGREINFVRNLGPFLSEGALHRYRGVIEIENLISLSESKFPNGPEISEKEKEVLRKIVSPEKFDARAVAEYDHFGRNGVGPFEHDVKSVEVFLRERLEQESLGRFNEFLHFPMTSEDVNNLAYNLMLRDGINNVWLPKAIEVSDKLADFSQRFADVPVLGKTHGMNASPTTFGKRFSYTLEQMFDIFSHMSDLELTGKFSGPVGNHNAMTAVAPHFDMEGYAKEFVESFGFKYSDNANQRNSHLEIMRMFNEMNLLNSFGADLCENVRHNVMMGWLYQEGEKSHIGSSVMPHKINPWFFEVGQGYFEQSAALIDRARDGLLQSVFERDLTDHPWERAYAEMIGKSLIGLSYISDGLDTLRVNDKDALEELKVTPEILSEAVQIAGRIAGAPNIYMTIKDLSRGKKLDRETLDKIIDEHIPDPELQKQLRQLTPEGYVGRAGDIARRTAQKYHVLKHSIDEGILDNRKGLDAVLFDFDNTLQVGDKDELHTRLGAISDKLGMCFTQDQIVKFGDRSDYREMRKLMVNAYNATNPQTPLTEDQFQAVNVEVSGQYDDKFRLVDGAMDLLNTLREQGYKTGLITTRGSNSLPRLLEMHGIADSFDVIINRDDAIERKPHPQPIAYALEKLGVEPTRAMYIGDKQVDDIIAGNALGMRTALINSDELDSYGAQPNHHHDSLVQLNTQFKR